MLISRHHKQRLDTRSRAQRVPEDALQYFPNRIHSKKPVEELPLLEAQIQVPDLAINRYQSPDKTKKKSFFENDLGVNSLQPQSPTIKITPKEKSQYQIRNSTFANKVRHFSVQDKPSANTHKNINHEQESIDLINMSRIQEEERAKKDIPRKSYYHPTPVNSGKSKAVVNFLDEEE